MHKLRIIGCPIMVNVFFTRNFDAGRQRLHTIVACAVLAATCSDSRCVSGEEVSYNFQVRPILSDRCYHCHGPDAENQASGLRLDTETNALADLGGYAAIVPGDLETSELHRRIWASDGNEMPPADSKLSLTDSEKEILDAWIQQGANFDKHWSFKSLPATVPVPEGGEGWAINAIDRFVHRKLAKEGLSPAREATREELIRRVTFSLTGLPPTLKEIDAYLADKSPGAYEHVVDRLLASPRFGERMTVDWLDLARYADTYGYQEDRYRDTWQWRDWVVTCFNRNLPFDEFITWQIGGDLLPNATDEQILATTFNRLHRQTSEGGSIEEEFRVEYVVDRVDTFGAAFLGLTLGCARCHDHKYDPITQKQYYELSAFFNNIDESGLYPFFTSSIPTPTLNLASDEEKHRLRELRQNIARAEEKLLRVVEQRRGAFQEWLVGGPTNRHLNGLVADFSFDDPIDEQTEEIENLANASKPGKLADGPRQVEGAHGLALAMDGECNFSTEAGGDFRRFDPFTIALWLKSPDEKQRAVVWHRTRAELDAGSRGYELVIDEGKLTATLAHFWPGNAVRVQATSQLPVGRWTHVAVTYDGSSSAKGLRIYGDGKPLELKVVRDGLTRRVDYFGESNIVDETKVAKLAHRLTLGQRFRDRGFIRGEVDELKVWNRELNAGEVGLLVDQGDRLAGRLEQVASQEAQEDPLLYDYYLRNHDAEYAEQTQALHVAREAYAAAYDAIPEIMVMREMPERRATYLLARGAYDAPTEQVYRSTPNWLPTSRDDAPHDRLELAHWLTDPANPLTSRVAVNRFWQTLLGHALVSTPLDFGSQGGPPSHPELLDWLARDFIDSGWDVKHLIKKVVMSATFRQSSASTPEHRQRDPENELLSRGPSYRLPAEMLRDSVLFNSQLLVETIGGPPVKPYQPAGLWKETGWVSFARDPGEGSRRRSMYTYWKRTSPPPSMMTFDCPDREVGAARRETTSTPLQPLVLLNDPQYVEAARALAQELIDFDLDTQLLIAFRRCTSRTPNSIELKVLRSLYNDQLAIFESAPERAKQFLEIGDQELDSAIDQVQLASLATTMAAIINLNESITVP